MGLDVVLEASRATLGVDGSVKTCKKVRLDSMWNDKEIRITDDLSIPMDELKIECYRSSGPGGQHVNTTDSAVRLRFPVKSSPSLPEDIRDRLVSRNERLINDRGELVLSCQRFRCQFRNKACVLSMFVELVRESCKAPRVRRATKVPKSSRAARLMSKRRLSEAKRLRRRPEADD